MRLGHSAATASSDFNNYSLNNLFITELGSELTSGVLVMYDLVRPVVLTQPISPTSVPLQEQQL